MLVRRVTCITEEIRLCPAVCHRQIHDRTSSRRLAAHSNTGRVATKLGNMFLDPFEGKSLVQEAHIQLAMTLDVRGRKIAECAKPVLDLDGDEAVVVRIHQDTWVIQSSKVRVTTSVYKVGVRSRYFGRVRLGEEGNSRIQRKTGRSDESGGAYTFRYRQSSSPRPELKP